MDYSMLLKSLWTEFRGSILYNKAPVKTEALMHLSYRMHAHKGSKIQP